MTPRKNSFSEWAVRVAPGKARSFVTREVGAAFRYTLTTRFGRVLARGWIGAPLVLATESETLQLSGGALRSLDLQFPRAPRIHVQRDQLPDQLVAQLPPGTTHAWYGEQSGTH